MAKDKIIIRERFDLGGNVFDTMSIDGIISMLEDVRARAVAAGMVDPNDGRIEVEMDQYGHFIETYYTFDRPENDKERVIREDMEARTKARKRADKAAKLAAERALYEKLKARFG